MLYAPKKENLSYEKVMIVVTGAGQISMAVVRGVGQDKKIILLDWNIENANKTYLELFYSI